MTDETISALLVTDANGVLYAIPESLLEQCRLTEAAATRVRAETEVAGYQMQSIVRGLLGG